MFEAFDTIIQSHAMIDDAGNLTDSGCQVLQTILAKAHQGDIGGAKTELCAAFAKERHVGALMDQRDMLKKMAASLGG